MTETSDRELIAGAANPLGWTASSSSSISTSKPQALGQVLEMMGFRPIARHRSREVLLYRQGDMNVIVNAHAGDQPRAVAALGNAGRSRLSRLRVRDAAAAYRHAIDRGAWVVPTQCGSDGAQHSGDPRRRREPHLLRRPLPRLLDLRRRFHAQSPASIRIRRRWPACTGSASSSTSAATGWKTGPSSTPSCSDSARCPTSSATASCPRGASCRVPCGSFLPAADRSQARAFSTSSRTSRCNASASARRTCSKTVTALRAARRGLRRVAGRAFRDARRADAELSRRRDVRAGAR